MHTLEGGDEKAYLLDICQMIASHEKLKQAQRQIKQSSLSSGMIQDTQFMSNLLMMLNVQQTNPQASSLLNPDQPQRQRAFSNIEDVST